MKKKYLITGITGFAGAHLAQLLYDNGHEVHGLIRGSNGMESDILDTVSADCFKSITFHIADLEDRYSVLKVFKENKFDGCYHLAAQSHPPTGFTHPVLTMRVNIMGTVYLVEGIERHNPECKFMFCSTSEVYGNSGKDGRKLNEDDLLTPSNPYAASKAAADLYVQERMMNGKIKGFITRAFSHTGIRRGKNFSISADAYQIAKEILENGLKSESPSIEVGNLKTTRVVIDVKDVVRAYYLLMMNEGSNGQVYNVCGDVPRQMEFFTDYLIKASGLQVEKVISPKYYREIDIHYQHGDTTKLNELTGWEPLIPIEKTLDDLLMYWVKKLK